MADNIYSAYHYQQKCKGFAESAATSAASAEEAKNLANEAVTKLGEFDSTVENAKAEITTLSTAEQTAITTLSGSEKTAIQETADTAKTEAVSDIEQAGAAIASYQQPIVVISETSGTISLESTNIYQMEITGAVSFVLPSVVSTGFFNQIKVMAKITGTPTVGWGTTEFFNKATPEIEEGSYDIYFDYDNSLGAWVCGVLPKGAAE